MPTFLSDPPSILYLVLAGVAFVAGGVWFNRRTRPALVVFLAVVGLIALLFLLDRVFESPREEAVRRVEAMIKAADARNPDAFVEHVAEKVEIEQETGKQTRTRAEIRTSPFWGLLNQYQPRIVAWDFSLEEGGGGDSVAVGFMAKGEAQGKPFPVYLVARFTRQPDGAMKLSRLETYDPVKRKNARISIPGFP
jgi:hypothetical protein